MAAAIKLSVPASALDCEMTNKAFHRLSPAPLNEQEIVALSLGTKTWLPERANEQQLLSDIDLYLRRINLYDYFTEENNDQPAPYIPATTLKLVQRNSWQPPDTYSRSKAPRHLINVTLIDIRERVLAAFRAHVPRRRPAKVLRDAMTGARSLSLRDDIVIKPADKNLGIAVMDKERYRSLIFDHLNDRATYEPLGDPELPFQILDRYFLLVQHTIAPGKRNPLSKILMERLPKHKLSYEIEHRYTEDLGFIIPYFYGIPKVHKQPLALRPICSSHSFFSTPLAIWLNEHLLPIAMQLQTVCHSSADVARTLARFKLTGSNIVFATGDVTSLYPNIPIDHATTLLSLEINKFHGRELGQRVTEALKFCLKNHFVQFEDVIYRQVKGTAMGVQFAPSFANIYLYLLHQSHIFQPDEPEPENIRADDPDYLDLDYVQDHGSPAPSLNEEDSASAAPEPAPPPRRKRKLTPGLFCYLRYIDDIFMIGTDETVSRLMVSLNNCRPEIKITWDKSPKSAVFLDLDIRRNKDRIDYQVYSKPSAMFLYAPFVSFHPLHVKKGWITTELLRFVRLSSTFDAFYKSRESFYVHLRARGYPAKFLNDLLPRIDYHQQRKNFLNGISRKPLGQDLKTAPFVASLKWSTFVQDQHDLRALLNPTPNEARHRIPRISGKRALIAFKTPKSIRHIVIRAKMKTANHN
jgi:hypothetical protein